MDWEKKFRNTEKLLAPILTTPLNMETTQSDRLAVKDLYRNLDYMNKLFSAEMAASKQSHNLARIAKKAVSLQKAAHAWIEGRPLNLSNNSGGSSPCSLIESCVTDDDSGCYYNHGDVSGMAGFKVYENPEFIGDSDADADADADDNHDSIIDEGQVEEIDMNGEEGIIMVAVQEEVEESEAGNDRVDEIDGVDEEGIIRVTEQDEEREQEPGNYGVEKEVIRVDYQKEENSEEGDDYEEEEEGSKNCCYKIIFWGLMVATGAISFRLGFSDFPDHYAPEMYLAPT